MRESPPPAADKNVRLAGAVPKPGRSFHDDYEMTTSRLGKGASGEVWLARPKVEQTVFAFSRPELQRASTYHPGLVRCRTSRAEKVAVKVVSKRGVPQEGLRLLLSEAEIHMQMDHPNIARLYRVYSEPDAVNLVMEHCSGGPLSERLLRRNRFSEKEARVAVLQILEAVHYCHNHPKFGVCHRDLKHQNCVYASQQPDAPLKLVDFGLAHLLSPDSVGMKHKAGTLHFMAPEVASNDRSYDKKCDLWSVGVIAYSLLCGNAPFEGATPKELRRHILMCGPRSMTGTSWSGVSQKARDFVSRLLSKDPVRRPSTEVALRHEWLAPSQRRKCQRTPLSNAVLGDVRKFASQSPVRRAAAALAIYLGFMPTGVDQEVLEQQFRRMDTQGVGVVTASKFACTLSEALGVEEPEGREIFDRLATSGRPTMTFSEFFAAAFGSRLLRDANIVQETFARFDENADGVIELGELTSVLGTEFCGETAKSIFDQCDTNGDLKIDLDEFSAAIAHDVGGDGPDMIRRPREQDRGAC